MVLTLGRMLDSRFLVHKHKIIIRAILGLVLLLLRLYAHILPAHLVNITLSLAVSSNHGYSSIVSSLSRLNNPFLRGTQIGIRP